MKMLDAMVSASFKKGNDGQTLFFPWGVLGRGFTVSNTGQEESIKRFLRRYYIIFFIVLIGSVIFFGAVAAFLSLVPFLVWYAVQIRGLTKPLKISDKKMTYRDGFNSMAQRMPYAVLLIFLAFSMLFSVAGLFVAVSGQPIGGMVTLIFSGACSYVYARMIVAKRKKTKG